MRRDLRRLAHWALSAAVVVLLVALARTVDWRATGAALSNAAPLPLAVATALNFLSLAVKGVVWWVFLRPLGAPSLRLALSATVTGAAFSNLAPANAGEAARVVLVSRASGVSGAAVAAAAAVERLLEVVVFLPLLAAALVWLELPEGVARWRSALLGAVAVLAMVAAVWAIHATRATGATRPRGTASPAPTAPRGTLSRLGRQFLTGLTTAATGPRLAAGGALALVVWVLQWATYYLVARACQLDVTLGGALALLVAGNVSFVVRATPGGVGVFQLVFVATAIALGLPREPAVAAAVALQALQLLPVTALGVALAAGPAPVPGPVSAPRPEAGGERPASPRREPGREGESSPP